MKLIVLFCSAILLFSPLFAVGFRKWTGRKAKRALLANILSFFSLFVITSLLGIFGSAYAAADPTVAVSATSTGLGDGLKYIGSGLAVGLSGVGGGIAVASSSAAALGAISENEAAFGKSLIFVGLAEGVALYGLIVALLLLFMF